MRLELFANLLLEWFGVYELLEAFIFTAKRILTVACFISHRWTLHFSLLIGRGISTMFLKNMFSSSLFFFNGARPFLNCDVLSVFDFRVDK